LEFQVETLQKNLEEGAAAAGGNVSSKKEDSLA